MNLAVPTIKCEESPSPGAPVGATGEGEGLLSVNLSAAVVHLAEGGTAALRTPEIVNDVITMTNPLDQYAYDKTSGFKPLNNDSNSSLSNASSATSPASGTPNSIQKTCSELIKAGLKLSIESKRKMSGSDTDIAVKKMKREDSDEDYDSSHTHMTKSDGLTPEDEERRRRRRERNKIAATKCRLKKRERTVNLVTESEVLETQNIDLKAQVKDLEVQKRQLLEMLSLHASSCVKNTRRSPAAPFSMRYEPPAFPPGFDTHSPYIRPESANVLASSYTCVADAAMEQPYMPQMVELEYPREMAGAEYPQAEPYLPKHNLLPLEPEQDYYEAEGYMPQPCHTYPPAAPDQPLNPALNDGCLV